MAEEHINFSNFQSFIHKTIFSQIVKIDEDEETLSRVLDELEDVGYETENILTFPVIYWIFVALEDKEYYKITKEKLTNRNTEHQKTDFFYDLCADEDNGIFYIYEVKRVKIPRVRKSVEELEIELKTAEKTEDYSLAAKIKKRIDLLNKPKAPKAKRIPKTSKAKKNSTKK